MGYGAVVARRDHVPEVRGSIPLIPTMERYIGYGKLLNLPSGRVGLELTLNQLEELYLEAKKTDRVKILVLPVKPENITEWRSHSVKIGESKYKQDLINEH